MDDGYTCREFADARSSEQMSLVTLFRWNQDRNDAS